MRGTEYTMTKAVLDQVARRWFFGSIFFFLKSPKVDPVRSLLFY